jgi:hypothetical protein
MPKFGGEIFLTTSQTAGIDEDLVRGGYKVVKTKNNLYSINPAVLKKGTPIYVNDEEKTYRWDGRDFVEVDENLPAYARIYDLEIGKVVPLQSTKAEQDNNGNVIPEHYATKEEVELVYDEENKELLMSGSDIRDGLIVSTQGQPIFNVEGGDLYVYIPQGSVNPYEIDENDGCLYMVVPKITE